MGPVLLVLAGAAAIVLLNRRRSGPPAGDVLRRTGFVITVVVLVLGGAFLAGEALTDPGGWSGVAITASWLLPLLALCVLARRRPRLAVRVLGAGVGVMVLLGLWYAVAPSGWRGFEDDHGPVRAVATFVLGGALGVLGLRRTRGAGVLLLVLGTVPLVLAGGGSRRAASSVLAAVTTPLLVGLVYLVASALPHARPTPVRRPARTG